MKKFREREFLIEHWQNAYEEEEKLGQKNDPVSETFRLVQFVSWTEWGKKRKKPREVRLLVINGSGAEDLRARRHKKFRRIDSYAEAVLRQIGEEPDTRAVERIIEILENRRR